MTTILTSFLAALILSNFLTPLAQKFGVKFGAMDIPDERKVHLTAIPRTGGLAIFVVFIITVTMMHMLGTHVSLLVVGNRSLWFLLTGAFVTFGIGFYDDFRRLGPKIKFLFQIIGATLAFMGGARVGAVFWGIELFDYLFFSYLITVFWFLLLINAINLVDGLDGLAGGIVLFASLVMMILSIIKHDYLTGFYFSIIAGAVLGFLRYNFNPASIFLGDGGSYFLGYAMASLSVLGSVKSQTGAAIAIPLLALGVPLFDTVLSPIRRFLRGRKMFRPDKGHIHHRLVGMGLTTRKAVLIIYSITLVLCVLAVVATNLRDEQAGLFLVILGAGAGLLIRKLGYFEYLASDKFYGWFKDMTDQAGFRHDRRSFLNYQIEISKSADVESLWERILEVADFLDLDFIELKLCDSTCNKLKQRIPIHEFSNGNSDPAMMDWNSAMHIMLPLATTKCEFGSLSISRDVVQRPLTPFTLRRIEQLRRTVLETLIKLNKQNDCRVGMPYDNMKHACVKPINEKQHSNV